MSSGLQEKLNKQVEKESAKLGKKIVDQQVHEKLGQLDDETDKHLSSLQSKLSAGITKSGLSLLSTVYFLLFLEHIPALILLVLIYFFSVILSILLLFVIIIVGGVYLVSYIIIYRFPQKLQKGSTGFFFAIILSCCEAFLLAYLSQVLDVDLLIIITTIIIVVLLFNTIASKCFKEKFNSVAGFIIGLAVIVGLYAAYMLLVSFDWTTVIISFILALIYQSFLIVVPGRIIEHFNLEENFSAAVFVTLIVYKKKIDYTFGLIVVIWRLIVKCCKKKDNY